jgi:hypothetical protein
MRSSHARIEVPERSEESLPLDDEAVWPQARQERLLRDCQQTGQGQVENVEGEERVPQAEAQVTAKMCRGYFHTPGTMLPIGSFYIQKKGRRAGRPVAECRECVRYRRKTGFVHGVKNCRPANALDTADVLPIVHELRRRIGCEEVARRAGISADHLRISRFSSQSYVKFETYQALKRVLIEARANGEDGWDFVARRKANLIPNASGLWGTKKAYYIARQRERQRAQLYVGRSGPDPWLTVLKYQAERNVVLPTDPDPTWWVHTGMEWVPRYGEEALGADF